MSSGKKTMKEKQTILLASMQRLSFTWRSRNNLESGCLSQTAKTKKYSIFCANNWSKIRTYTVPNTLSGDCNVEVSGLRY